LAEFCAACAAVPGGFSLLVHLADLRFVLLDAALCLLERSAERVDLRIHVADFCSNELLRGTGRSDRHLSAPTTILQ
jgi:hypothetical protein